MNKEYDQEVMCEMPKYKCTKKVWALKIKEVVRDIDIANAEGRETDGSGKIVPMDDRYAIFSVDHAYMRKHEPKAGGYYVLYKNNYASFSPAEAFEDGYDLI